MVKYSPIASNKSSRRMNIPLKLILFWYNRIKNYIDKQNVNKNENFEYPTLFISKKYPKMSILELYIRIRNHLKKHYPNIYNKLNPSTKVSQANKEFIKIKEEEKKENKNEEILYEIIFKGKELSDEIKHVNEINCSKIKHLFKSYKFDERISEKYNNCFIKIIDLSKNGLDISSTNKRDELSTTSILSSSSNDNNKNKISFVTHLVKPQIKSKIFQTFIYENKFKKYKKINTVH